MIDSTFKNANILIVDDKESNIEILSVLLEVQGYTNVKTTTDSRLVAGLFKSFNPDLILLDLMMPYFSGYEVMEQLKELIPDDTYMPILVLTADITNEAKKRALSDGAKDFLSKPFDLIEVGLRIKNLLLARFLHQQVKNQNQILEEKVKARTVELEKTNSDLILAKEKAESSDRLKTVFIQNISHEIRTPLNGIIGFGQMLVEPDITQEAKDEYLPFLKSSADRLINTVSDYMDIALLFSDNVVIEEHEFYPSQILDEIYNKFNKTCKDKKLTLTVQTPQLPDFLIKSDHDLLRNTLSHLVDNAIKFTKQGKVSFGFEVKPNELEFFVKDTGIGIEPKSQEMIFEPFNQENNLNTRNYEGSGLGLTIAKKITEMIGGRIWVNSAKNEGSEFYFTIPFSALAKDKSDTKNVVSEKAVADHRSNLKILIVEDLETSDLLLTITLRKICREILHAKTGIEAIDVCRNNSDIDLILMDFKMPEMDGYEATRQIRQFNKNVMIIAQTAYVRIGDRQKAIEAGCNDYLSKPVETEELMALIDLYFKVD